MIITDITNKSDGLDDGLTAWNCAENSTHVQVATPPLSDLSWTLVSTADYVSSLHVDADGAATAVVMMETGQDFSGKWWIIGTPTSEEGDMNDTSGIPAGFDPEGSNVQYYSYRAVWLRPGDMLYVASLFQKRTCSPMTE